VAQVMPQKERVVATELPVDLIFKFETLLDHLL